LLSFLVLYSMSSNSPLSEVGKALEAVVAEGHRGGAWRMTRFIPSNAHVEGLSIWEANWGPGELDGDQTKAEGHVDLPRFGPLER
jgi:hypothetical protein